jgi:hypothetical protein
MKTDAAAKLAIAVVNHAGRLCDIAAAWKLVGSPWWTKRGAPNRIRPRDEAEKLMLRHIQAVPVLLWRLDATLNDLETALNRPGVLDAFQTANRSQHVKWADRASCSYIELVFDAAGALVAGIACVSDKQTWKTAAQRSIAGELILMHEWPAIAEIVSGHAEFRDPISLERILIAEAGRCGRSEDDETFVPTERQLATLAFLCKHGTTAAQDTILTGVVRTPNEPWFEDVRTLRIELKTLRKAGLTRRPHGERKGEAITDAGRRLVSRSTPVS